jgi:HEAT repeat protein
MKAVRIHQYGGPEVLVYEEAAMPTPRPDQVLVRVEAATVNPIDVAVRENRFPTPKQPPKILGSDGAGVVEGVGTDDSCAARAIASLGERMPADRVEAALRRALGGAGRPQTAQACLEALALLGRAEAEGLILLALRSEDDAVARAAARAIGKVGTVAAVAALREAAEGGGEMRRAARQAIAEIQGRLTGAEPGQLSLAGGEAGALSLADGEPGRLSLAEESCHPEEHRPSRATRDPQAT